MASSGPSRGFLWWIYAALLGLLVLTAVAAKIDMGIFNFPVAMLIAAAKTTLIFLFFMHLYYQRGMVRLFAVSGFFWLAIMGALTFTDYLTRGPH